MYNPKYNLYAIRITPYNIFEIDNPTNIVDVINSYNEPFIIVSVTQSKLYFDELHIKLITARGIYGQVTVADCYIYPFPRN